MIPRKWALLVCAAAAVGLTIAPSTPAWANGGDAIGLDVQNTAITSTSPDGLNCTYQITSRVTVVNLTQSALDISAVHGSATWENGSSNGVVDPVTIVDTGGLQAGDTIDPGATSKYEPVVTDVTIPCAAPDGDLAIRITDQFGTGSGDAPFLSSGVPLPIAAIGGLTLAGLMATVLVFLQRRHRHPSLKPTT